MAKRGNNEGSIFKRADGRRAATLQVGYENGQRGYERLLRVQVIPGIGRITLRKLNGEDLAALYSDMLKKGLAPRTVQYAHVGRCRLGGR